ncbi:AIPR family protein [Kineococcus radiotolerans]|uniref:AIPR family protein n=1 Tax=Kineococcus radiotolerans TaxID=131568 RepID=UPI001C858B86|nr:AIPR family protein [Kineococcus radiotolerans]
MADEPYLSDPAVAANPLDADLSDYILRQNDGGVDGYLEDESNKVLLLIQSKYLTGRRGVKEEDLKSFFDLPSILASPARDEYLSHLDSRARAVISPLRERMEEGWSVVLRFMTNKAVAQRHRLVASSREATYVAAGAKVRCEIAGAVELEAIWQEATGGRSGIQEEVSLRIAKSRVISFEQPRNTLVAVVSGRELAELYNEYHNRLFAQNIRLPLLGTTRINPEIVDTARRRPRDFFYFNNGVSAICTDLSYARGVVRASDLQIINGAQTVGTLGNISDLSDEVQVLFRLTTTPSSDTSFRDEITRTNNTQNEVVPWDFRSNDPIQQWLETSLARYSGQGPVPHFWYKRKRGLNAGGRGGRALEPEYLGKLRHAYLNGPIPSYREAKRLASTTEGTGLYWEAFGVAGQPKTMWPGADLDAAMFAYALDSLVVTKAENYKANKHAYGRWLKRLSRYVVGVIGHVARSESKLKLDPSALIVLSREEFDRRLDDALKAVMRKINHEYDLLQGVRVQPEYDIARDQKMFERICAGVIADLTA